MKLFAIGAETASVLKKHKYGDKGIPDYPNIKELSKMINDFEHVTTIMRKSKKIKKANLFSKKKLSNIRVTLDEKIDFQVIKSVINYFKNNLNFSYGELC